jgi:hypothetical protein
MQELSADISHGAGPMLEIFWMQRTDRAAEERMAREGGWRRDPLSHPDIARMSQRQLGDLPFGRARLEHGAAQWEGCGPARP